MSNPWEKISLDDYENHMRLESVMQLQAMNEMMKYQFDAYPVSSVMILGIAGGNGLVHISKGKLKKIYGIDINASYLEEVIRRYPNLNEILECLCVNLLNNTETLPKADMVIANLLIEYIGYECFQKVIKHVVSEFVSCIIQINTEDNWISDSPYLHVFDELEQVHHQIEEKTLREIMIAIGYCPVKTLEHSLPNGKKLVQIDFQR
ncbi:MAG: class I SAM-dependent methyltransferase [Ruminococcus sp.]|nr:class I SAM-dependent methyltransferase [Ruminococcus sp.]